MQRILQHLFGIFIVQRKWKVLLRFQHQINSHNFSNFHRWGDGIRTACNEPGWNITLNYFKLEYSIFSEGMNEWMNMRSQRDTFEYSMFARASLNGSWMSFIFFGLFQFTRRGFSSSESQPSRTKIHFADEYHRSCLDQNTEKRMDWLDSIVFCSPREPPVCAVWSG